MSPFHMQDCSRSFVLAIFIRSRLAVNAEWRQHLECARLASFIDFPKGIWVKRTEVYKDHIPTGLHARRSSNVKITKFSNDRGGMKCTEGGSDSDLDWIMLHGELV